MRSVVLGSTLAILSGTGAFVVHQKEYQRQGPMSSFSWYKQKFDTSKLFGSDPLKPTIAHCEESLPATDSNECTPDIDLTLFQPMDLPDRASDGNKHAIFGTLVGEGKIEDYQIYKKKHGIKSDNLVVAFVKLGNRLNGHHEVVHGGILSLIFDDVFGFGYESLDIVMAVTANLTVDFRAPVPAGTTVQIALQLEHREGRKIFFKGQMTSLDGEILYAESKCLYIIPRHLAS